MGLAMTTPDVRDLRWARVIELFLGSWAADHPGLRPATIAHYREQLETRLAAFAAARGIVAPDRFRSEHMTAFVTWLDEYMTARGPIKSARQTDGPQLSEDAAEVVPR